MTNEKLPTDDPENPNVNKLIQQANYNGLFDGKFTRDFEFKWDIPANQVGWKTSGLHYPSYNNAPCIKESGGVEQR